jgi:FolB domain-containing protein
LFAQKPQACNDDNILHTLCYATIYQKIINFCNKAEVKTLEFLTNQLWEFLQNNYKQASFNIEVVKLNPPINGHQKPISFAIESF